MSDTGNMHVSVETITPDRAREYLGANRDNRTIRQVRVNQYANLMRQGQWMATGDPIRFDPDGRLLDGQHRLLGLIAANATIDMLVLRDVPTASFQVLDSGYGRSIGQALGTNTKSATTLAAACRLLWLVEVGCDPRDRSAFDVITRVDIAEYYEHHEKELRGALHFAQQINNMFKTNTNRSAWTAFMALAWRINDNYAHEFHSRIHSGLDLGNGDARLALRNSMIRGETADRRASQHLGLIIKTWNDWMLNRRRQVLVFRPVEEWPALATERVTAKDDDQ